MKTARTTALWHDLKQEVDDYFRRTGKNRHGGAALYLKAAVLVVLAAAIYVTLLLYVSSWTQALPLCVLLGVCLAGIAFNIPHDASHGVFCRSRLANQMFSMTFDLFGASSYCWYRKHCVAHHGYTNVESADADIDLGIVGRLSPYSPVRRFHRYQHFYLWLAYGLLLPKWQILDDAHDLIRGRIGMSSLRWPKGRELAMLIGGKATFLGVWFVLPATRWPLGDVMIAYAIVSFILGMLLSVVFQLAHCVEEAQFSQFTTAGDSFPNGWERHQIEATVNFAERSSWLTWYVGGLNHQIEHHLFPGIYHVHYAALAPAITEVCKRYGVRYTVHESLSAALASHYRFLQKMGRGAAA
jgi:linoleoyl-CoA desaturase